jgi:hypothetical protein
MGHGAASVRCCPVVGRRGPRSCRGLQWLSCIVMSWYTPRAGSFNDGPRTREAGVARRREVQEVVAQGNVEVARVIVTGTLVHDFAGISGGADPFAWIRQSSATLMAARLPKPGSLPTLARWSTSAPDKWTTHGHAAESVHPMSGNLVAAYLGFQSGRQEVEKTLLAKVRTASAKASGCSA